MTEQPRSEQSDAFVQASAWAAADPDPRTRAALEALLGQGEPAAASQIDELFDGRIAFGTAGLRASMGPGPKQMNRLVVRQTTAGLMEWLPDGAKVVIGYDARHNSEAFARDTALEVAIAGGQAELLPGPLPTPVLARAVLARSADAGVMVTASHNPPADNGYKLYLGDGIQLVGPADAEIAAAIDAVAAAWTPERSAVAAPDGSIVTLGDEVAADHLAAAAAVLADGGPRAGRFVYTAMHGVGGEHFLAAMESAGFDQPLVVAEQFTPDPDFPTAAFPNPEEPGALDLAMELAASGGPDASPIEAIIAHDPDADRLALAVADRDGRWVRLTGDQVGVLLADHLLQRAPKGAASDRLVAKSIVSSQMIERLAEANRCQHITTLTGFKWVARPIVDHPDAEFVLGYEEALGYCVGSRVRDKDGISAGLLAAEMLAGFAAGGRTVWDRLDELAAQLGVHLTGPVTIRLEGADGVEKRSALLAGLIGAPPALLAGANLVEALDLSSGRDLPPTPGIVLRYDDGSRVIVRPSGTEPKLKAYIEVVEPVGADTGAENATKAAGLRLAAFQAELLALLS